MAKRLREEFGKLQVEINDEKSRTVDLERGESFGFLGFDFRYLRSRRGAWRPHYTPKLKKRTALMRELKAVFRRYRSQPIERVINLINPVLRGWVNYFAVGHSSECFSFIKDWVEKKVRRHLAHAQKRKGFDWERWNRRWLYDTLGGVDSKDSLLGANQIQGFFLGGSLGCEGPFGFERRGVGADGAADHRSA